MRNSHRTFSKPRMTLLASLMLPVLSAFAKSDLPIQVESDQVDATLEQKAVFTGNVQIVQGGLRLKADHGIYDKQKNQVEVSGAVEVETEKGHRYQAQSASFNLDNKSGYAVQPSYQIPITPELTARGCAKRVDFADEEHAVIEAGNYTTCEGLDPDWYLAAEKIELDQTSDTGYASQGRLYFKGVPILGSPYISFPLSSARKSGFLPPIFTATSKSGFSVSVPYYWNIAPQYDMTFYPRIITRRGLQLGINGRYLNEKYLGETNLEFLPNDQKTQTTRYALSSKHQQILSDKTGFNWNINLASDDSYADDFARSITDSSQRQLLRDFQAYYNGSESHASLRLSNYQVLQDLNAPVARPYDRLPQLQWGITKYSEDAHWQASLNTEYTRFWHPTLVRGDRVLANLQTSYSWLSPAWFLTPKFSVYTAQYNLSGNNAGLAQTTFSRALPSFSIDTGWFFERPIQWRGKAYSQTLEPRLFYVYTPYKDQKQFPNFDSGEADFNFAQIFSDNIFTGSDRIADANQLTVGITSRLIDDEKGDEQMRFAFAQ